MTTRVLLLITLFLISLFCVSCLAGSGSDSQTSSSEPSPQNLPLVEASLAENQLRIMLARSDAEKRQGLMYYTDLSDDQGMLFVYDEPIQMSFWMKNTYIPLDLVFFDQDLLIAEMIPGMIPGNGVPDYLLPRYQSVEKVQFALELASGTIQNLGLKIGDQLKIPLTRLFTE